jgi:hypothetical protein
MRPNRQLTRLEAVGATTWITRKIHQPASFRV